MREVSGAHTGAGYRGADSGGRTVCDREWKSVFVMFKPGTSLQSVWRISVDKMLTDTIVEEEFEIKEEEPWYDKQDLEHGIISSSSLSLKP